MPIALRLNSLFGSRRKGNGPVKDSRPNENGKEQKEKEKERGNRLFARGWKGGEMGPWNTEVSENEVNVTCRHINLANFLGGGMIGVKNVLALSILV